MVTLVLLVCLSATPNVCREEEPPIDAAGPMACMFRGQLIAAEWLADHPKWQLSGWRCQVGPRTKEM